MSIRVKATAKYVRGSTRRAQLVVRAIKEGAPAWSTWMMPHDATA
ncbi:MAG: hypothetical protein ACKN93_04455 [Candidatus Limnocylindrus sp.]